MSAASSPNWECRTESKRYGRHESLAYWMMNFEGCLSQHVSKMLACRSGLFSHFCYFYALYSSDSCAVLITQTLRSDRPYEHMNITDVKGLTVDQKAMLKALGAIEDDE